MINIQKVKNKVSPAYFRTMHLSTLKVVQYGLQLTKIKHLILYFLFCTAILLNQQHPTAQQVFKAD